MLYNTLSTLGMTRSLDHSMKRMQIDLTRANQEIADGVHADVAATLGARTGRDIALRNMLNQTEQYLDNTDLLDGRMGLMDSAMTSMLEAGTDLLAAASTGLGQASATGSSLQVRARGVLDQIVSLLNASGGDVYLFSGTSVEKAPMRNVDGDDSGLRSPMRMVQDAITAATGGASMPTTAAETTAVISQLDALFSVRDPSVPATPPLTDSYEGGFYTGTTALQPGGAASTRLSGQASDAATIDYGVQANDAMFRNILEGAYMLAALDTSTMTEDAYPGYIKAAVDKLSSGLSGLQGATAQLGIQRAQVASIADQQQTRKAILNLQINNMESVDPYEASTRISQLEAQIDATASATARIANLHLTNYL